MSEIKTDPEIANLCRPLTAEEKAQLEENIKADGCTDPLKLWGDILLDGHNRLEICKRLGLPFNAERIEIKDRAAAVNWVIANQLGRRNLIPEDVAYLRGKRYQAEKKPIGHTDAAREEGRFCHSVENHQAGKEGLTGVRLAKEFGVSDFTVRNDAKFADAVDKIEGKLGKDVSGLIRTGKAGLPKKEIIDFAKDGDMTLQKFNDARFERQQRLAAKPKKDRKKSAPKHGLSVFKKSPSALDTTQIERMRPFMNAVLQISTAPVKATTLADDPWPSSWRQQVEEALPIAQDFLRAFAEAFLAPKETPNGGDQAEAGQHYAQGS